MRCWKRYRMLAAAALALAMASSASAIVIVKRMTTEDVTREAGQIAHGTVTDVRSGRDERGLPATWVTLEVVRTLKGHGGRHLTFKQAGVAEPLPDGTATRIVGMPRYHVGDEVVLFLRDESAHGFTSPVGFGQGVYRVKRQGGQATVRSDLRGASRDLDGFLAEVARHAGPAQ